MRYAFSTKLKLSVFIELKTIRDIKDFFIMIVISRVLIFLLLIVSARAQVCSNIFYVYRDFEGLHADIIKSNNYLESVIRLEVIMSVATPLNGVNF